MKARMHLINTEDKRRGKKSRKSEVVSLLKDRLLLVSVHRSVLNSQKSRALDLFDRLCRESNDLARAMERSGFEEALRKTLERGPWSDVVQRLTKELEWRIEVLKKSEPKLKAECAAKGSRANRLTASGSVARRDTDRKFGS